MFKIRENHFYNWTCIRRYNNSSHFPFNKLIHLISRFFFSNPISPKRQRFAGPGINFRSAADKIQIKSCLKKHIKYPLPTSPRLSDDDGGGVVAMHKSLIDAARKPNLNNSFWAKVSDPCMAKKNHGWRNKLTGDRPGWAMGSGGSADYTAGWKGKI